jgi:uncharacterized protein YkwD
MDSPSLPDLMTFRFSILVAFAALFVLACHEERERGSESEQEQETPGEDSGAPPAPELHPSCEAVADWSSPWRRFEDEVLTIVNQHRAAGASCGGRARPATTPLVMDPTLRCAARLHSLDMAQKGYFDHTGLDGRSPFDRIDDVDYDGSYPLGENIAWGSSTARQVMEGWMNSPGHCENIMNPEFGEIGVGYAFPELGRGPYWTQKFGGHR